MLQDPLFLIVAAACLLVLVILMLGIGIFAKGGKDAGKKSNLLMRYRIYAQALAVVLILVFLYFRSGG